MGMESNSHTSGPGPRRSQRNIPRQDYRKLVDIVLPRAQRSSQDTRRLYPIDVVERRQDEGGQWQVKIHYLGYASVYDEWRAADEIVKTSNRREKYVPYSLYADLASRIKACLCLGRKADPEVRIDMPFDRITFDGGLRLKGRELKVCRGVMRYGISACEDLDEFFGANWHVRGLNEAGDFNYIIVNTVQFWLYQRRPLVEYVPGPPASSNMVKKETLLGSMVVFSFVCGRGVFTEAASYFH